MAKQELEIKRINIPTSIRDVIMEEFKVTRQTVFNALRYHTFSDDAYAIRKRAKELLIKEAKKVK